MKTVYQKNKVIFVPHAGYVNLATLSKLCDFLNGVNIDLKVFDEKFCHDINGASLKPVLDNLK